MAMTDEALLNLAVRSIHDRTAQPVLGDAILERKDSPDEWYDERVMRELAGWRGMTQARLRNRFFRRAAKPDRRWCKLVAGFMMFGEWEDEWPLIEHLYPRPTADEILREMWSSAGIREMTYGPSPFLQMLPHEYSGTFMGVNREADPTRLAGMRIAIGPEVRAEYDALTERIQEAHTRLLSPREAVIAAAERCAAQAQALPLPPRANVLADLWHMEIDTTMRRFARGVLQHHIPPRRRRTG